MIENIVKMWQKMSILSKKIPVIYYVIVFFVLVIFVANELFLWHKDGETDLEMNFDMLEKEVDSFVISAVKEGDSQDINRELQGTIDSGFESSTYGIAKNIVTKDLTAKISTEKMHSGKNSLHIQRDGKKPSGVRLNDYAITQKDQYYKIGLWISSVQNGNLDLLLANGDRSFVIAHVGVVGNVAGNFGYYEYNFRAPLDAQHVEISIKENTLQNIFVDDVKMIPLNINAQDQLSTIRVSQVGNGRGTKIGESQLVHDAQLDVLGQKNSLIGQIFVPRATDFEGVSFFMKKKGDGGINEYTISVREFDEKSQKILSEDIAVHTFSSKDITSDVTFFPLFAKLNKDKKYWVGISNDGVNVNKDHHMEIGQSKNDGAYANGYSIVKRGENGQIARGSDLYFETHYGDPVTIGSSALAYGSVLYDLGGGQSRIDQYIDPLNGSNVLDLYAKQNITVDKWKNIFLKEKDAYVTYKIGVDGTYVKKLTLNNIYFHNNMHISLSTDGQKWTEIFADNSGKQWQNSGKIDVVLTEDVQNVFIKMKKNGEKNCFLLSGQIILNLVDQKYVK